MKWFSIIFLNVYLIYVVSGYNVYERYSGQKTEELKSGCSIKVKQCTPHEGRRVDGTCNNFHRPSRGSAKGSYLRLLKPQYGHHGLIRKNKDHEPLPSARKVRTLLWSDGRVTDGKVFNRAAAHFLEFIHNDISLLHGPEDFLRNRTYCCQEKGRQDKQCAPVSVPPEDPYLRTTNIRCMNFSRAKTFQDLGCISKELDPEQVNYQTPALDLSTIYGVDDDSLSSIRLFEHGLLREQLRKGRYVPLNETRNICFNNKNSSESVCYKFGFPEAGNTDLTTTMLTIFFYREHNRIARVLHKLNPCWKDDRLFKVARQINIATAANIFLYELLPIILGENNMVHYHLFSKHVDYVSLYDEQTDPLVFAEYENAKSFFLTLWDGRIKKYSEDYHYTGELTLSETIFKQELIEKDSNFEELNRGTFYQRAGRVDDIIDPDISENYYSLNFKAHDKLAMDIQRGRDMGLRGYNSYRRFCGQSEAKKFEDLVGVMSEERVGTLKRLYKDLEDVDLLAGILSEHLVEGAFVGPTLFCLMVKQLQVFRFSDRFWFERGKQMHSFTPPQLQEIRKTNMARVACDNAEGIKYVQPHALSVTGNGNEHVPCSHINGADLTKWKDHSCSKHHHDKYYHEEPINQDLIHFYNNQLAKQQLEPEITSPKQVLLGINNPKITKIPENTQNHKFSKVPDQYSKPIYTTDIENLYRYGQTLNHYRHGVNSYPKYLSTN